MAARDVFAHTANRLSQTCHTMGLKPTMSDLLYLLTRSSVKELHAFLKGTEAARHIHPSVEKQASSILSTLTQAITPLGFLKDPTPSTPGFSIRKWMADDNLKGKVFLTSYFTALTVYVDVFV